MRINGETRTDPWDLAYSPAALSETAKPVVLIGRRDVTDDELLLVATIGARGEASVDVVADVPDLPEGELCAS